MAFRVYIIILYFTFRVGSIFFSSSLSPPSPHPLITARRPSIPFPKTYTHTSARARSIRIVYNRAFVRNVCVYLRVASSVWMRGEKNRLIVLYECVCITIIHSLWYYVYCKKKLYILLRVVRSKLSHLRVIHTKHTPGTYYIRIYIIQGVHSWPFKQINRF